MGERHRILIGLRRLFALQPGEIAMLQRDVERAQPVGPLGVAGRGDVLQKNLVLVKTRRHPDRSRSSRSQP